MLDRHEQDRIQGSAKLPATLCLALLLFGGLAHADDTFLIKEANTALAQKDYSAAFSKFSVLAQHGNATAQFNVGAFYLNGQGVQKDEKQAFEWFGKSAAQGNARALQILQNAAAKGSESAKNELNKIQPKTASAQTQPATPQAPAVPAVEADPFADANAALARKDYATAFPKFLALAQQGNAAAQFNVGAFYLNGQGVQKDEKQAYDWFAKSAAQGNERAAQVIQTAEAKANEDAKNKAAQSTAAVAPEVKAKPKVETNYGFDANGMAVAKADGKAKGTGGASRAGSRRSAASSSSDFSLGLSLGQTGKITDIKNSSSFGLLGAYRINSSFGVEVAYNMLYRNANADSWLSAKYPGTTGTFDLSSVSAAAQYTYSLSDNLSLLGNLGVHTSSYKIKSSGSGATSGSSSGLVAGGKVQYDLNDSVGIRGGFDMYTLSGGLSGNITEVGMAVITRF